jgi:GT2 family glycosyltransferase
MDVSIVIASYNTLGLLRQCLQSITQMTRRVTYEILVVDNNSTDGSPEMLVAEFPWVKLLRNDSNIGFGAAQNKGMMEARGRFCLVLNSDVLFKGDVLSALVAFIDQAPPDTGAAGPRILNRDGSFAPSARRVYPTGLTLTLSILNRHFAFSRFLPQRAIRQWLAPVFGKLHDNFARHDTVAEAGYLDGMCVLIKREVLEHVGLFDEQFFFDFEIGDWSIRAHSKGWKLLYYPGAEVIHVGHASRRLARQIVVETHRSELIYFSKHFPQQVQLIRTVGGIVVGVRYAIARVQASLLRSVPAAQSCQIYARILDLLRSFDAASVDKRGAIPAMPLQNDHSEPVASSSPLSYRIESQNETFNDGKVSS